ncbi:MAG: serine hydrolase, partial [Spirochaetota bacterium]
MLLEHSSGIRDRPLFYIRHYTIFGGGGDSDYELSRYVRDYLKRDGRTYRNRNFGRWTPGAGFEYSNIAIATLATVAERASGEAFSSFTAREIFSPLGMTRTTWFLGEVPESERGNVAAPYFAGGFRRPYGYPDFPAGQLR